MSKVTLDMGTFKALASDTRLQILRTLDGKKLSLKDISNATNLNKATLHEHLTKLNEAGLVKRKERKGHKWVYYKLSWKGECLLHPENTKIVVLFTTTFLTLFAGIISFISYARGKIIGFASVDPVTKNTYLYAAEETGGFFDDLSYGCYRNVANVPNNQTITQFSQALNDNATNQGVWKVGRAASELKWQVADKSVDIMSKCRSDGNTTVTLDKLYEESVNLPNAVNNGIDGGSLAEGSAEFGASGSDTILAIVQDPNMLYIAIICVIICTILLGIGIWRLWINKEPKI